MSKYATTATFPPNGGQKVSLSRDVLVRRLKGKETVLEPAKVIRIHDDDQIDVRSLADLQEVCGFRYEHVGRVADLELLSAGAWCWPPRV
jgi:hypothetical protein